MALERDAIERRKAAVRRDGRTLYHTGSYRIVNPLTRTHNSHDACVFYPDGARCMVMRPFAWDASVPGRPATKLSVIAQRAGLSRSLGGHPLSGERDPWLLVQPWLVEPDFLPCEPPEGFSKEDLVQIRIGMLFLSPNVENVLCAAWRDRELQHEACSSHALCVIYRPPGPARSADELATLGVRWAASAWQQPLHLTLEAYQADGMARRLRALHESPRFAIVVQTRLGLAAELAAESTAAEEAAEAAKVGGASEAEVAAAEKRAQSRAEQAADAAAKADAARDVTKPGGEHALSGVSEFAAVQQYFRSIQPLPHRKQDWLVGTGFALCEGLYASFPNHVGVVRPCDASLLDYVRQQAAYITTIFIDPDIMQLATSTSALLQLASDLPTVRLRTQIVELRELACSLSLSLVAHECALAHTGIVETRYGISEHHIANERARVAYGHYVGGAAEGSIASWTRFCDVPALRHLHPTFVPFGDDFDVNRCYRHDRGMHWFQVPGATTGTAVARRWAAGNVRDMDTSLAAFGSTPHWGQRNMAGGLERITCLCSYWQEAAAAAGESIADLGAEPDAEEAVAEEASSEPDYDPEGQAHLEWLVEQELSDSESSEAGAKPKAPRTKEKSNKRRRGYEHDSDVSSDDLEERDDLTSMFDTLF